MATIINVGGREIKEGIVNIHRRLELRKLRNKRLRAGKACRVEQASATSLVYRGKPES